MCEFLFLFSVIRADYVDLILYYCIKINCLWYVQNQRNRRYFHCKKKIKYLSKLFYTIQECLIFFFTRMQFSKTLVTFLLLLSQKTDKFYRKIISNKPYSLIIQVVNKTLSKKNKLVSPLFELALNFFFNNDDPDKNLSKNSFQSILFFTQFYLSRQMVTLEKTLRLHDILA